MLADPTLDQCRKANDLVLRLMETDPDLAYGFCYVSQAHERQAVEEIRRCARAGMRGIKLWVAVKCNDKRTFPIAEEATSLGVPLLIHSYLRWEETLPGESCSALAPLHNPPNLGGIEACERTLPGTVNIAVFDSRRAILKSRLSPDHGPCPQPRGDDSRSGNDDNCLPLHTLSRPHFTMILSALQ